MRIEVLLPKWGMTMQEATVIEWHVDVGARVTEGDVIATIETEKVDGEVTAPASGTVVDILAPAGDTCLVGAVMAFIETD